MCNVDRAADAVEERVECVARQDRRCAATQIDGVERPRERTIEHAVTFKTFQLRTDQRDERRPFGGAANQDREVAVGTDR